MVAAAAPVNPATEPGRHDLEKPGKLEDSLTALPGAVSLMVIERPIMGDEARRGINGRLFHNLTFVISLASSRTSNVLSLNFGRGGVAGPELRLPRYLEIVSW